MTHWFRIAGGWAANLDGTDASLAFTLPHVEVRSSPAGWTSECFFADGSRSVCAPPHPGSATAVMAAALAHARRILATRAPERVAPAPAE